MLVSRRSARIHVFQVRQVLEEKTTPVSRRARSQRPVHGTDAAAQPTKPALRAPSVEGPAE